jgi:predicted RNase H-like nuclease
VVLGSGTYPWPMHFLGIDLAWAEGSGARPARDSGVIVLDQSGEVVEAGWTSGLAPTQAWIEEFARAHTLLFIDAPLIVDNPSGQRLCETQVGQCYGRWKVSANTTNLRSSRLAGVHLRQRLEVSGWRYDDGRSGPPTVARVMSECYPYTTLVGASKLGYLLERPPYKRRPKSVPSAEFRPHRAATCDELIARLNALRSADPPLDLSSHRETRALVEQSSPHANVAYKRREDLIDAVICAWTAALWFRFGFERCQVLGLVPDHPDPQATIIAPCRPEQRISPSRQM